MHECILESEFLANAEVDSMRGVIDGGVGTGLKASPRGGKIDKVQEVIRLEIDCREERLRELEFLEKGGDPLDFNFGRTVSVSEQSTSLTDQHQEQIVTSRTKDCCVSTALRSQHEEVVESFGKLGDTTCEVNSGDNLLLFDGENKLLKDRNSKIRGCKNTVAPSEFSTQTGGTHKAKGAENSAIFRPYARRNRSKSNRDGGRSASMDVAHLQNNQASAVLHLGTRDALDSLSEANSKDQKISSILKLKSSHRISDEVHNNDRIHNVESVGLPKKDKLTNTLHRGRKEHAIDAKNNGNWFGSRKDHEKTRDATSCSADIEAEEINALTNCGSFFPDAATTQHTGIACGTDGLEVTKKMNCIQNDGDSGYPEITAVSLGVEPFKYDSDKCTDWENEDSDETRGEPISVTGEGNKLITEDPPEIKINPKHVDPCSVFIGGDSADHDTKSSPVVKVEDEACKNKSMTPEPSLTIKLKEPVVVEAHMNQDNMIVDNCNSLNCETAGVQTVTKVPLDEASDAIPSGRDANCKDVPGLEACNKLTDKMVEDSILAEAKIIQAKCKRIAELSVRSIPLESCQKCHWDFVLEEVAWSANDFMQERLWKITAAAQISRQAALSSHLRDQKLMPVRRLKFVAHLLAKAVMEFWHASELLVNDSSNSSCGIIAHVSAETETAEDHMGEPSLLEPLSPCKNFGLKSYALKFLKYNSSTVPSVEAEEPKTLNNVHDLGVQETSGESCITEDDLFYKIPPSAMECYRTSIEFYVSQCEKNGSMQKADDITMHDVNEEISQENGWYEDEGETSTQYLPGIVEWSKASKFPHKKQKNLKRAYPSGSYDLGVDLAYGSHSFGTQKSILVVKRPAIQNVVSIPTKRVRTASRHRVLGSSSGVSIVNILTMDRSDDSSGDTNSYQDDQSSLHGGSQIQRTLDMESPVDFGMYLPVDSGEIITKHKKKKKSKNMNSSHDQRRLHESAILDDTGDHSKRRLDSHFLDSNGSNGLYGQHGNKKLKVSMQKSENMLDYGAPTTGSMPSPAASQMSNMPNVNEYKKVIANRDRLRQDKVTKLPIHVPPGSGSAWTSFEEQALVVLVHDMGPNWELVSDAINSTLQFKRIFRGPKDCKEKHKMLMDQTPGDGADGADSADDSGSSQPYPSTMPGIPKGSARQLFQRLHAPMEQDTVKSHFEKIIMIGKKQHHCRNQCDSHDQKHITPHNSHMIAISQVSPNNLNGGCLTPLDLIDAIMSSPDAPALGYQTPQTTGLANQNCVASVLPPTGVNSVFQGPVGNSLSSPSGPLSHRNGRYSVSRTSLPIEDQQRIQQLNPMFSGGNIQQSTMSVPGPHPFADRFGARKLQGGNGMGMAHGINNRGMPMSRPGFQGLSSPAAVDSAAAHSPGMVNMPSLDMQSAIGSSQGNSMQRLMDNSHQIRPGQSLEHHRQMMVPELQMRATQANSHCVTPINRLNASYTSQAGPSSAKLHPVHSQQKHQISLQQSHDLTNPHHAHLRAPNHAIGSQHPAYARLVKERQLQQQQMLQHQQQYSASNSMMSQTQRHLPVSLQNSSQVQHQSSQANSQSSVSPSSPTTPIYSQLQQKHHLPPHGLLRDSQSGSSNLPSQVIKQRQRHPQHQQQSVRVDTAQQRQQQLQSQQHDKQLKGEGKGNMVMLQNATADQVNLNGQSPSLLGQSANKVEQDGQIHGSQNSV